MPHVFLASSQEYEFFFKEKKMLIIFSLLIFKFHDLFLKNF